MTFHQKHYNLHRDDPPTPAEDLGEREDPRGMEGYPVKLPKKGDLSSCNNWRGICSLSKQDSDGNHPRETQEGPGRDSERSRQVFAKTDTVKTTSPFCESSSSSRWNSRPHCNQYSSTSKRHLKVWIEASSGGL